MFKALLFLLIFLSSAYSYSEIQIKQMIGQMIIIGFDGTKIDNNSSIYKDIKDKNLGGVILFDKVYNNRSKQKNIINKKQLATLNKQLQAIRKKPLIISIDQEGGKVARLKEKYGFLKTPSASFMQKSKNIDFVRNSYSGLSKELTSLGINCNFAPVVDLAINPNNKVIYQLNRSYSDNPKEVSLYASIFINALHKEKILSVLKHFPGHGSSLGDSHQGFVDISNTWREQELEPYKILIKHKNIDMIMTAHVFNKHLDKRYPATLSYNINTKLLRQKLNFQGVIISDDLQMKAISEHYTLKQTLSLAINSGVNILLFGNQLGFNTVDEITTIIYEEIKKNNIDLKYIIESNQKIIKMLDSY